ncbi:amino acid adenylation domain-containing protein [Pseudomonas sp. KCJK8993]|uniref:non-ribosomal peptide synthetase n=1 Tax=Pseudomonas sp. KCJK8993 TaxID=3344565 RepID=UPI00390640C1
METSRNLTIVDMFERQANLHSSKIALYHCSDSITYGLLNEKINRLARHLIERGVEAGDIVAVCVEQSISRVVFMMAIVKVGAVYLPLDPDYPTARFDFILEDTQAELVITSKAYEHKFFTFRGVLIIPDSDWEKALIDRQTISNLLKEIPSSSLMYVIYTSGSTGIPKGVAVQHSAIASFIENIQPAINFSSENTAIQILSYTFDASFVDTWMPLLMGATLYLYPNNKLLGEALLDYIRMNKIDTIPMITPTILATFPTGHPIGELKSIVVGGEACADNVFLYWASRLQMYNLYGPTETTVAVTCHKYVAGQSVKNIGSPLSGVDFYVLDEKFQPSPAGSSGELFIGGAQLAKGYLNRPELTEEKFLYIEVINSITGKSERKRLYRTGDIVTLLPNGNIEYIGRNDTQLKVRGFRIESGEIENSINRIRNVRESAVVVVNKELGQSVLAAFVTLSDHHSKDEVKVKLEIRKALQNTLPSYMVPDKIFILDYFPQTASGKIDRKALQSLMKEEELSLDDVAEDDVEGTLIAIWKHVLQSDDIKAQDNVLEIGGNSVAVVRAFTSLPESIRSKLTLVDLYTYPCIEQLAQEIKLREKKRPLTFEEKMHESKRVLLGDIKLAAGYGFPTEIDSDVLASPENILLTGVTGFVGVHLLLELLEKTSAKIYCLVRAGSTKHAIDRIKSTLSKYRISWPEEQSSRIAPILGDFTHPQLGMSDSDFENTSKTIQVIYHIGGNVNYVKPYAEMSADNVNGIQEIIRFATTSKLKYLVACSTIAVFSWGHLITGKTWMCEDDDIHQNLPAVCRDTNYVRSKWVMENILEEAKKKGLPVIGIRPGFVMCQSDSGATEMNQWWGSLVRCCVALGTYPMIMGLKDQLVTVDFVAKAIVHISQNKKSPGKFFHLVPEPVHDISLSEFFEKIKEYFGIKLRPIHYREWLNQWRDNEHSPLYSLLSLFTEEVAPGKSLVESYEMTYYFDRKNTSEFLKGSGIETPPIDKSLLSRYLDFMGISVHTPK